VLLIALDHKLTSNIFGRVGTIILSAERHSCSSGHNNSNLRKIGSAVGMENASVHCHFSTPANLATEPSRRYTDLVNSRLGLIVSASENMYRTLPTYSNEFYVAAKIKHAMCVCGLETVNIDISPDTAYSKL